jgi:hypothetical protein
MRAGVCRGSHRTSLELGGGKTSFDWQPVVVDSVGLVLITGRNAEREAEEFGEIRKT